MVRYKPKKPVTVPSYMNNVIQPILEATAVAELSDLLEGFDAPSHFEKPEERSLVNWYEMLNKFDELLDSYIKSHEILSVVPKACPSGTPFPVSSRAGTVALSGSGARLRIPDAGRISQGLSSRIESLIRSRSTERQASNSPSSSSKEDDTPAKKQLESCTKALVVLVLKATFRVVRNASHDTKLNYNSYDHILTLIVDPDPAVSILALEILHSLHMRSSKHRRGKQIEVSGLAERLFDVALGWGGREKGLGLVDCCNSLKDSTLPEEGHSLVIEFKTSKLKSSSDSESSSQGQVTSASSTVASGNAGKSAVVSRTVVGEATRITVRDVRELATNEKELVTDFVSTYKIPRNKIFSMLCAYRRAKAFGDGRSARLGIVCQQLIALTTLAQLYPPQQALNDILDKETELISDIVTLAKADAAHGLNDLPKWLRTLAVRCLASMTGEKGRMTQISHAAGLGNHHGMFASLLRTEIAALSASVPGAASVDNAPAPERMDTDATITIPASSVFSADTRAGKAEHGEDSMDVRMAEALLSLVLNIASNAGSVMCAGMIQSGVLGIIMPLIRNRYPPHSRAVSQAIRAVFETMHTARAAVGAQSFRDNDGLNVVAERIVVEVLGDGDAAKKASEKEREEEDEKVEEEALKTRGESRKLYEDLLTEPMTVENVLRHPAPSSSAASRGLLPHSKWTLLRALHQLMTLALNNGGSAVRELVSSTAYPLALRQILARPFHYGGGLFASATLAASSIAHSEPVATTDLVKSGISKALLRSISVGLPPNGDALKCVPTALAAICLSNDARDEIVAAAPVRPFLLRLARPFYSRALHSDAPAHIGTSLDEMMRHVEAMRENGSAAMIEFLKTAAAFVELDASCLQDREATLKSGSTSGSRKSSSSNASAEKARTDSRHAGEAPPSDLVVLDRMKLAVANNATSLIGNPQGSLEHQKAIVSGQGLHEILKLRLAPALASPKVMLNESHSSTRALTEPWKVVNTFCSFLRTYTSRHDSQVLAALFAAIRNDAGKVLRLASKLSTAWLAEEETVESSSPNVCNGTAKRLSGSKDSSVRKRSRSQSTLEEDSSSSMKETKSETKSEDTNCSSSLADVDAIRTELKNALCVLRVDVVLLSSLSKHGSGSICNSWDNQSGAAVLSLLASVERLVRTHLAVAFSGLTCVPGTEGDLWNATVFATKLPAMAPMLLSSKIFESVQDLSSRMNVTVKPTEVYAACKTFKVLPEKDNDRFELKGLAWAMETFSYSCQKLYMHLARGLVHHSRRHRQQDPTRYGKHIRGLAATIAGVFVLHLKASESLWSRNVTTIAEANVCAAWDYVRRIVSEIKSTLFCESNRNTQGLILRFFLSAGGAHAIVNACKPLALLKGSRATLDPGNCLNATAYETNKKRFESFLKSPKLSTIHAAMIVSRAQKMKRSRSSGNASAKSSDTDAVMKSSDDIAKLSEKEVAELEKKLSMISANVLHYRKQATVQKTAGNAWSALCGMLQLFSNCPGLLTANPNSLPQDPEMGRAMSWHPKDIQRSSQFVSMKLLMEVTKEPSEMLSSFNPTGNQTSDVVSIILSILRSSSTLASSSDNSSFDRREAEELDRHRRQTERFRAAINPVRPEDLRTITEMGFPEDRARRALEETFPAGPHHIEQAIQWLMGNEGGGDAVAGQSEESNEEESDDDDEGNESGGGDEAVEEMEGGEDEPADAEMNPPEAEEDVAGFEEDPVMLGLEVAVEVDEEASNAQGEAEDIQDLISDDSIRPVVSDREQVSSSPDSEEAPRLSVDEDAEELLKATVEREFDDIAFSVTRKVDVAKADQAAVLAMVGAVVGYSSDRSGVTMKGTERQRILSRGKPVTLDNYISAKKALFESLIPVAKVAIEHEMNQGSSSQASFVAVEILSILQKDKCLNPDVRLEFAKLITSELEKFLVSPRTLSNGLNSVVGIRVSFVWAHYGGSHARNALKASGVSQIAFNTLLEMASTWESAGASATVDEEATKPIKYLSINEKMEMSDESTDEAQGTSKNRLTVPRKSQSQALNCLTTCLLILDAFVRYHDRDSIIEHAESNSPSNKKSNSAMEVDGGGMDEKSGEASAPSIDSSQPSDSASNMDVDEEPVDLAKLSTKVKRRAEEDKKKATEQAVDQLLTLTGRKAGKKPLPFSGPDLLRCCIKLLSSLSNYDAGDTLTALLQLICSLTMNREMSEQLMKEGGVELLTGLALLETRKQKQERANQTSMIRAFVRTILRHVIEDEKTLTEAMEVELRAVISTSAGPRSRPLSTRTVIQSSAPLVSRDLECFTRALARCARARNSGGSEQSLQLVDAKAQSLESCMEESKKRENVVCVVGNIVKLLGSKERKGVGCYALSLLSEMVQLCPVIVAEFLQANSPVDKVKGSALDYVVQALLAAPDPPAPAVMLSSSFNMKEANEKFQEVGMLSESARALVVALLGKTIAYKQTVKALADAARIESDSDTTRGGMLKSLSLCVAPNKKMKVLKEMIDCDLANHLAKCLDRLDMTVERNADITADVLRALSVIGQASEQSAGNTRRNSEGEEVLATNPRDMFASMRDRDAMSPLAGGHHQFHMVL